MRKVIFISGKITGEPISKCIHKFMYARNYIYQTFGANTDIKNPLKLEGIHFGISHEEAMKICLETLKDCTHIYILKDWEQSKGAIMEHDFAKENGIKIIYEH